MNTSEHSWSLKSLRGLSPRERQSRLEGSPDSTAMQRKLKADLKTLIHWVSRNTLKKKKNKQILSIKCYTTTSEHHHHYSRLLLHGDLTLVFIAPFLLQLQETQDHFKDCPPLVALQCLRDIGVKECLKAFQYCYLRSRVYSFM